MTLRRAFTLIEVNLAMLIMAGGILSIVGLYAFGFRENSQSREDVAGAALADAAMSSIIAAVGAATDISKFNDEFTYPSGGWSAYLDQSSWSPISESSIKSTSESAFSGLFGQLNVTGGQVYDSYDEAEKKSGLIGAIVISHDAGSGVIKIAFRATKNASLLMSQPVYYTEARFQGVK